MSSITTTTPVKSRSPLSSPTTFTWPVTEFSKYESDGFVASPHFAHEGKKFYLTLLPHGVTIRNAPWSKSHVFIYLWLVSDDSQVELKYAVSLLKSDGSKFNTQDGQALFLSNKKVLYNWQYNISRSYLLDLENDLLAGDTLTVHCQIEATPPTGQSPQGRRESSASPPSLPSLSTDLATLQESAKFADIKLNFSGAVLSAHKALLAARSPVFGAMFEHDTKEAAKGEVNIDDIEPEVGRLMLGYIYTDRTEQLDKYAFDLLIAADKYQLESLKHTCEAYLLETITTETVSRYLLLAYLHASTLLQARCIDYLTDHATEVMATDGWKEAIEVKPELGLLLFKEMVKKEKK